MKILTNSKIEDLAVEIAKTQIMMMDRCDISDELLAELTKRLKRFVRRTGGEYGIGKYSEQIANHYLKQNVKRYEEGKVIAIGR